MRTDVAAALPEKARSETPTSELRIAVEAARALERWGSARAWRGPDPYDALNATRLPPLARSSPLALRMATQAVRRSPMNLRPFVGIAAGTSAATLAHVISAYALGEFIDDDQRRATPTGTIGSCPSGITPPSPYCNVPATQPVSANISKLTPCTTYHFRLVATNPDGSANGGDKTFTTSFAPPLSNVSAPAKVKAGHKFKVKFTLRYEAQSVSILIQRRDGTIVKSVTFRPLGAGKHSVKLTAPSRRGNYILVVRAKLSCGTQTVRQRLKVH